MGLDCQKVNGGSPEAVAPARWVAHASLAQVFPARVASDVLSAGRQELI
jgi:hypothetical protein